MSKTIYLTRNKQTVVDDEDFETLSRYNWSYTTDGYAQRCLWFSDTKTQSIMRLHRQLLNAPKGTQVDHINGDRLDNRRENLRLCSNSENSRNRSTRTNKKYSVYKGVTKVHGKYWAAQLKFNYEHFSLGYYGTEEEAARAYDKKALQLFGSFAKLNFKETA